MIELYLTKINESSETERAGKYYPRVSYKQTLGVREMAQHMSEHNTMFSEGSICGILIDFVKCVREQVLNGNTVKIDNLAIFKATVEGNGLDVLYDSAADKVAIATMGTLAEGDKTGPAVKVIKLLAQSTGDFTRDELKKDVKFSWTDKTKAEIVAAKGENPSDSQSSQSGNSGDSGNSGSQTPSVPTLTVSKTGSGSSAVTVGGNAVNSGSQIAAGTEVALSVTPAAGQTPTATLNGSSVTLTESDGTYTGTFQMPDGNATLVINSGSSGGGGVDQN